MSDIREEIRKTLLLIFERYNHGKRTRAVSVTTEELEEDVERTLRVRDGTNHPTIAFPPMGIVDAVELTGLQRLQHNYMLQHGSRVRQEGRSMEVPEGLSPRPVSSRTERVPEILEG